MYEILLCKTYKVMVCLLLAVFTSLPLAIGECPKGCRCSKFRANCRLAELWDIPANLSDSTEYLSIEHDNISVVSMEKLTSGGGLSKLLTLRLQRTETVAVIPGAFEKTTLLRTLSLGHNKIASLHRDALKNLKSLRYLDVSYNELDVLQPGVFAQLSSLRRINLSYNKIKTILPGVFSEMLTLVELKLRKNKLQILSSGTFDGLVMLRNLDVSYNNISVLSPELFQVWPNTSHVVTTGPFEYFGTNKFELMYNSIQDIEPGTFEGLASFTYLDLKVNKIHTLKQNVFCGLSNLRILDLSHNYITVIHPEAFNGLANLDLLFMGHTNIQTLHSVTFRSLPGLQNIFLGHSNIQNIEPGAFDEFSAATFIDLSFNKLQNFSCDLFRKCVRLRTLNLGSNRPTSAVTRYNKLQTGIRTICPNAFEDLSQLRVLKLNTNSLRTLEPVMFHGLKSTAEIDLSDNEIDVLTSNTFIELVSLTTLKLTSNQIYEIELGAFHGLRALKYLDLSRNNISSLSDEIFRDLNRLAYLKIECNPIKATQSETFKNISALKELALSVPLSDVTDTADESKPSASGSLQRIELITTLKLSAALNETGAIKSIMPGSFEGLDVRTLHFSDYSVSTLEPDTFRGLNSLRELSLKNNKIKTICTGAFRHLHDLCVLDLSGNSLIHIPAGVFGEVQNKASSLGKLEILNLYFNRIESVHPKAFSGLISLKHLDLNYNEINILAPDIFQGLWALQVLDLHENEIAALHPETFRSNSQLRSLDLSNNRLTSSYFLFNDTSENLKLHASVFENNSKLVKLHIAGNNIETIDFEVLKPLTQLKEFGLQDNPLVCDCRMHKIWQWIIDRKIDTKLVSVTQRSTVTRYPTKCRSSAHHWNYTLAHLKCKHERPYYNSNVKSTTYDGFLFFKRYVEPIVLGIIFLIGAVGNLSLLAIFSLNPEIRTGPNACVLNLALGDLLSLVGNLPISYAESVHEEWQLGSFTCKMFRFVRDLTVGVTVFSVVALAFQRYGVAVFSFRKFNRCHFASSMLLPVVWTLSLGLAVPSFVLAKVEVRCLSISSDYGERYVQAIWLNQLFVYFAAPICVIVYLHLRTARRLVESARNFPGETQVSDVVIGRKRVAKMILVLTTVFCFSYGPNFIVRVLVVFSVLDRHSEWTLYLGFASYCLFFCNICFNPIAMYCMSSRFRKLFRIHILCEPEAAPSVAKNCGTGCRSTTLALNMQLHLKTSEFSGPGAD